ncbi:hypothetical protein Ahy_B09g099698 isoform K [Arachis hypogaea]|uniref:Uncharacterized protein n=1 Tax=Arachis hypogaea TaxID=3818 RepID=A0A444XUJ2_ARAHY|nr:hypothetical protein Ahy_B09g099698 isoform K [Arachis hypogaea]
MGSPHILRYRTWNNLLPFTCYSLQQPSLFILGNLWIKIRKVFNKLFCLLLLIELTVTINYGVVSILVWLASLLYHVSNYLNSLDKQRVSSISSNKRVVCYNIRNKTRILHFGKYPCRFFLPTVPTICIDDRVV